MQFVHAGLHVGDDVNYSNKQISYSATKSREFYVQVGVVSLRVRKQIS